MPTLASEAERLLADASPLVRGAAVWALGRLDRERLAALATARRVAGTGADRRGRMDGRARSRHGVMATLVCLGLGYCARHYVGEFGTRFDRIVGTTRSAERAAALAAATLRRPRGRDARVRRHGGLARARRRDPEADALLVSAAPADGGDPVLAVLADEIAHAPRLRSVVLLSTLGVYGDSGGAWIDETAEIMPTLARRGSARIDAELAWQALGARRKLPVAILRLGGIYGPGRTG